MTSPGPQARGLARAALHHVGDQDAFLLAHPEAARQLVGHVLDDDAEPPAHHPALGDELPHHALGFVDRDGEADPLPGRHDRGVDPDHAAVEAQQRPAGVPGLMEASVWMKFS